MVDQETFHFEWGSLLKWAVATSLGFFINDGIGYVINTQFPTQICALLNIIAAGMFIGVLQWLFVLRSYIPNSEQWIGYSTIGWATGWIIGNLFSPITLVSLLTHGTILGLSQSWFFRRRLFRRSYVWILVNSIGLPVAYGLSWYVLFPIVLGGYSGPLSGPADSIVRGILFGVITGVIILWFSHNRSNENTDSVFSNAK